MPLPHCRRLKPTAIWPNGQFKKNPYLCALSKPLVVKNYLRKKTIAKFNTIFSKGQLLPNSILVLFDSTSPENAKIVTNWLRKHRDIFSNTRIIGVEAKNPEPKATIFPIIGKKDLTWYNMIKPDAVLRVMPNFLPDYLLVLHKKPTRAIDAFAQAIPANLKISHQPILKAAYNIILDQNGADWQLLLNEIDVLMPKVALI